MSAALCLRVRVYRKFVARGCGAIYALKRTGRACMCKCDDSVRVTRLSYGGAVLRSVYETVMEH